MKAYDKPKLAFTYLLFALMFVYYVATAYSIYAGAFLYSLRGWTAQRKDGPVLIVSVNPQGPAAALQKDDEVVALKGQPVESFPLASERRWKVPAGTRYTIVIRRDGRSMEFGLETVAPPSGDWSRGLLVHLIKLLFLATGLAVFLLKPSDKQARLLALLLATLAVIIPVQSLFLPLWLTRIVAVARNISALFLPIFLHFFLIFPEPSPLLRKLPRLERYLYLPFYLIILPWIGLVELMNRDFARHFINLPWLMWTNRITVTAYLVAGLIALVVGYRYAERDSRRKLHVVMAGSAAGFFNLFLMPIGDFFGLTSAFPAVWRWLDIVLLFTLPLIPLSFAYAIIRHRVIPVSLIIRRGVRYMLVSRGSAVLEVIAAGVIVTLLLRAIFIYLQSHPLIVGVVSAVVGIVVWNITRTLHTRYLAPVIDRRFFRQAYDSHQILADLTESLRTTTSLDHLLELVATRIQAALQTENVTIFLPDNDSGDFFSAYSCDYSQAASHAISTQRECILPYYSAVVRQASDNGKPMNIGPLDFPPEDSRGEMTEEELEVLREVKSSLLLPLSSKDGVLGIISLGPRLGDLPYSREDERLLMSVAGPATFAIENACLVEQMIVEASLRQELEAENELRAKELEEARQLQLSMLPRQLPQLPHLEIAAYMKPATEVGGDYYDFHLAEDGTLTIAVGDATGHGLKAGTVVTATKSLFNHLAQDTNIPAIFQNSSRALKLMNFRTLFMAMTMIKVKDYQLTLSSAGMPPVLIYRTEKRAVEEISLTGIPLGSLTPYPYREQSVNLGPGDVVVLMSDGFPERFNGKNEMLDYESAKSSLAEVPTLTPQEIIDVFVKIGDKWADGRPQDDDMTFVVLKVRACD